MTDFQKEFLKDVSYWSFVRKKKFMFIPKYAAEKYKNFFSDPNDMIKEIEDLLVQKVLFKEMQNRQYEKGKWARDTLLIPSEEVFNEWQKEQAFSLPRIKIYRLQQNN